MSEQNAKQIIFSGIQPSGQITIGNYLGALANWVELQDKYDCIFCVVDMHAITVQQTPSTLRNNTLELAALYFACGINPEKSTVFVQSHVPAHAELAWVLNTLTYVGELNRMTQFKEKARRHSENLNMGLMDYPVLMASDILLYQTDLVPVGADQKQHLELARDLAARFNARYSPTFAVPEPFIPQNGARIMSLSEPTAKMSKSDDNDNGYVSLTDSPDVIRRKFRRAVTDSDTHVRFGKDKPAISNLLTIYSRFSGISIERIVEQFEGRGYGELKDCVADAVIAGLEPVQKRLREFSADKSYIAEALKRGAEQAAKRAEKNAFQGVQKNWLCSEVLMFGYLNVEKERLTQGEYGLWHTFLCGVCLSAKRLLNNSSRLTSNYDINFFNVLFHSYLNIDVEIYNDKCAASPFKKRPLLRPDEITDKLAQANVILMYYNLLDDKRDGGMSLKKKSGVQSVEKAFFKGVAGGSSIGADDRKPLPRACAA